MGRALGMGAMLVIFAVLLPDVFAALKIFLLKFLTLASLVLDSMGTASLR